MDKSCQSSSSDSSISNSSTSQYLKNLNKLSHKISKPIISTSKKPPPSFDPHLFTNNTDTLHQSQPQPPPPPVPPPQQHQPPVYNINKSDFRDVVQKLTGSPAHERFSTPPPIQPPKPPSSRLQRIRPPPLAHVSNRPPPMVTSAVSTQHLLRNPPPMAAAAASSSFVHRPPAPLSPLPPFPAVHAAAESPVSAYMRYLQNSVANTDSNKQFSGFSPLAPLLSPRWNNQAPPQSIVAPQQGILPSQTSSTMASQPQFQLPPSPLPFGCLNSPRSPHPFFSPVLLLSPSAFPLSPTLPVMSPKWKSL